MGLRAFATQVRVGPQPWLIALAVLGLGAHAWLPPGAELSAVCGRVTLSDLLDPAKLRALIWSPWTLLFGWAIMTLAMMPPLVSKQVSHVWLSSLPGRQHLATAIFGVAYLSCWVLSGLPLIPLSIALSALLRPGLDTLLALALALVWSASPLAQIARNRCHKVRRISAFGHRALLDSFRQGVDTGASCIASCWLWMMVPMTVESGHDAVMIAVALYLFAERLAPAGPVRWRLPPGLVTLRALGLPKANLWLKRSSAPNRLVAQAPASRPNAR